MAHSGWDNDGKPYMIYCHEWLQNWNGTMEKIELKPDLSGSIGKGKILFRASDSPWSREKMGDKVLPNLRLTSDMECCSVLWMVSG